MYKILEQNGVENENIDGGAFNNFAAGGRDGIIAGVLTECALAATGNSISISSGLLIICGIRVKITSAEVLSISVPPVSPNRISTVTLFSHCTTKPASPQSSCLEVSNFTCISATKSAPWPKAK